MNAAAVQHPERRTVDVQLQTIVDELQGKGNCPSTGKTGAITSLVMDQICGIL